MISEIVKAWLEEVIIPTYPVGKPEKNPVFFENRVYQGSSGKVYPYPIIEKIYDEKIDKKYNAVFLENRYLKIMILPELGGRVQMAFDKIKQRHFVYFNSVIKPALVGLNGPWISGGIEFNWPQHHRPSTFEAVDFKIENNNDGSCTVWVNEVEQMFHTKGMAGFSLYPDKAYLEVKVQLYNRTFFPQTFLWWANPALQVNDHYQSVFPPDVHAVFDHGKRDVSEFPIAKGIYYKVDYAPGTDISRYKNIPVPTSYMAIRSKYDFLGGYEHDTRAGFLTVANHHLSPGKKQWTWGNGDFGKAWDRNLTDEDGPYVELMAGVYTDNQPDFSWLMPHEEKSFVQYFMPYSEVGLVKNATKEALVNLELADGTALLICYATSVYNNAVVLLKRNNEVLLKEMICITPEQPYTANIKVNDTRLEELSVALIDANGKVLVSYQPESETDKLVVEAAAAAGTPENISSVEQLYLTGLHLEQYRHATYKAEDYYLEALKREPDDVRNNNAMGLLLLRRGKFEAAVIYFHKAIEILTRRNLNPYDGEPFYNLGRCLQFCDKPDEAYEAFYKSVWNAAWQDNGYFALAQLATIKGNADEALDFAGRSLVKNWHNHKARHLKSVILRKLKRYDQVADLIEESIKMDPFNIGCLYEKYLLLQLKGANAGSILDELKMVQRSHPQNYIAYALDYTWMGLYEEALAFILLDEKAAMMEPMIWYYRGWIHIKANNELLAKEAFDKAATIKQGYYFPNQLEAILALQCAVKYNPADAKAYYYLGNLWYDKLQYNDAIACWERCCLLDPTFPTAHRNLALAYYNKQHKPEQALVCSEKAFSLDTTDARVLMELDQLYKKLNHPLERRLAILEQHTELVLSRDDLYLERITLYNSLANYEKARQLLKERIFHPWEGGEGKVTGQYVFTNIGLAQKALLNGDAREAIALLNATDIYPHNLGEGKLLGNYENEILYLKGCAYESLNEEKSAQHFFALATQGLSEPTHAFFYNDRQPDTIFYQGLALQKLNKHDEAALLFQQLIEYGKEHLQDIIVIDFFAVSLPDLLIFEEDLQQQNRIHCYFMMALGYYG